MEDLVPRWQTLEALLQARAAHQPERPAYIFLLDGETQESILTYRGLHDRARTTAVMLRDHGVAPGDRVLLPHAAGAEGIVGFFGCIYAGAIATFVPPVLSARRVAPGLRVVRDARPRAVLGAGSALARARTLLEPHVGSDAVRWIDLERETTPVSSDWQPPPARTDDVAYLQYASGATTAPRGVMITHANVLANVAAIEATAPQTQNSLSVQWLPLFHDMGLVTTLYNLYVGFPCVMFPATQFSQRPMRWLEAISRYRATSAGGPDSAFAACAELAASHDLSGLDLSSWELAFCGAEPVRGDTMRRFIDVFAPHGFRAGALYPCYGLAEATLSVSGGNLGRPPVVLRAAAASLRRGHLELSPAADTHTVEITSCGPPVPGHDVRIVNPDTSLEVAARTIGEIWVKGPSVSPGYWGKPDLTAAVFGARLADTGGGPFLRTGDHGFLTDGELHVTGRLKDLIVVNGANHYPQDIEFTVRQSHARLQRGRGAAFGVGDSGDRLVIVQEMDRRNAGPTAADDVLATVRRAVAEAHGLDAEAIVLVRAETIPVTSSGKVQRYVCRDAFVNGNLTVVAEWCRPHRAPATAMRRNDARRNAIERWLIDHVARRTGVAPADIDARKPFADYGLESADAVALALGLEQVLGVELPATVIYSYPSISELADHLAGRPDEEGTVSEAPHRGAAAEPQHQASPASLSDLDVAALLEKALGT